MYAELPLVGVTYLFPQSWTENSIFFQMDLWLQTTTSSGSYLSSQFLKGGLWLGNGTLKCICLFPDSLSRWIMVLSFYILGKILICYSWGSMVIKAFVYIQNKPVEIEQLYFLHCYKFHKGFLAEWKVAINYSYNFC